MHFAMVVMAKPPESGAVKTRLADGAVPMPLVISRQLGARKDAAVQLLAELAAEEFVLPVQTLGELFTVLTRKTGRPALEARMPHSSFCDFAGRIRVARRNPPKPRSGRQTFLSPAGPGDVSVGRMHSLRLSKSYLGLSAPQHDFTRQAS